MKNTENDLLEQLKSILIKKAKGFSYNEETNEYVASGTSEEKQVCMFDENNTKGPSPPSSLTLSKRKVSSHYVPPDLSAVKMLMDLFLSQKEDDFSSLSEEELKAMKEELIKELNKF